MLLGQWFAGFHEFHLSFNSKKGQNGIRVWAPEDADFWLTDLQSAELYRQAAWILTHYYDVQRFNQLLLWHHAAGDFVVNLGGQTPLLRLVTARRYGSMVKASGAARSDPDVRLMFEALLIFLLNLSIRIRLDRLDGVGEIAWADDIAVETALDGFFAGLSLKPSLPFLPAPIAECFRYYLLMRSRHELAEYARAIADSFHPASPERPVVRDNLDAHLAALDRSIQKYAAGEIG